MNFNNLQQKHAAKLIGVTPRTLRDWEDAGEEVPRNRDGTYEGIKLVAFYVARCLSDKLDPAQQRARRDCAAAEKLELENARTRGEQAPIAEIADWYGGHIDRATTRLGQVPDALGQLVEPRIAAVVVPECRRLIHEAQLELATESNQGS